MARAIRIHRHGGPEVMIWEEIAVGRPGTGEVVLRQTAVGLNFIDTYNRSGLYPLPELPAVLGREGVGIVEEVGSGVLDVEPGDRVAYVMAVGAYAEKRLIAADQLVPLPDDIDDRTAAAVMLKGLTAHYLLRRTYPVKAGETVLIHAAAGGVGLLACQWAKQLGATVIGTVGSPEKAALAASHGCDHPILYGSEDFHERVMEITSGKGVAVVYDSVGEETFLRSLNCLAPLGMMVSYGQSSKPVAPFAIGKLAECGSLFLTRPTLGHYIARREELLASSSELLALVADGLLRVEIRQSYPLRDAANAHRDLESRKTTGSTVLLP